jgi:hypothetical protein
LRGPSLTRPTCYAVPSKRRETRLDQPSQPDPALIERIEALLGERTAGWQRVSRGYTPAARWLLRFTGGSAFVKAGTTADTSAWLRSEAAFYQSVRAPFVPRFLGFEDAAGAPILLLEDLSKAQWPPPWDARRVELVLSALADVAATASPAELPRLSAASDPRFRGWREVALEPEPFLALGLCSSEWLERCLPVLVAEEIACLPICDGDSLLHLDVRSDNLCFDGDRTLLVDWNHACLGNALVDVAFWLPSLEFEGGPPPEEVAPEAGKLAALVSGFFAARAGLPNIPDAPFVRRVQREQLSTALPWAVRVLGLPRADGAALSPQSEQARFSDRDHL